jgi:hypothetical protein
MRTNTIYLSHSRGAQSGKILIHNEDGKTVRKYEYKVTGTRNYAKCREEGDCVVGGEKKNLVARLDGTDWILDTLEFDDDWSKTLIYLH